MDETNCDGEKNAPTSNSAYPSEETINLLATGIVNLYQADLEKVQKDLSNLT